MSKVRGGSFAQRKVISKKGNWVSMPKQFSVPKANLSKLQVPQLPPWIFAVRNCT